MKKLAKWLDQHLNPILIQETRYVLSLQTSLVVYLLLLFALGMSASNMSRQFGEEISTVLLGAFSFVAITIIPAQLLFSSATRWSKQKLEMIQLTPLKPLDIVGGRVVSALSIVILILSVVMPFVSLTYLVPGVDLSLNLMSILMILSLSLFAITFSISIAWVSEQFSFHLIGKIIWLGMLFMMSLLAGGIPALLHEIARGGKISPWIIMIWFCSAAIFASSFAFARSIVFLRHPEENCTTPIRSTLLLGLLFVFLSVIIPLFGDSDKFETVFFGMMMVSFTLFCSKFLLEPDRIGRRALIDLPKSGWKRFLLLPLLPGTGTAILLMGGLIFSLAIFCEVVNYWQYVSRGHSKIGGYWYMASWWFAVSTSILPLFRNAFGSDRQKTSLVFSYYLLVFLAILMTVESGIDGAIDPFLNPFVGGLMIQEGDSERTLLMVYSSLLVLLVLVVHGRLIYRNVSLIMGFKYEPPVA